LVSDVPRTLPYEKTCWLKSLFLGYNSLKHIYVDEIFNMEYFILQFDSLTTMRNVVNKFNNYGSTDAKLIAMNYTRPRSSSSSTRIPTIKNFKIIDMNGTESQKQLAIDALSALTHHDAFQIVDHQ